MYHLNKFYTILFLVSFYCFKTTGQTFNLVKDINQTKVFNDGSFTGYFTKLNNLHFFAGWAPETGTELWISDGTDAGTKLLKDIHIGSTSSNPEKFTRSGNLIFFLASSSNLGLHEMWRSDGTETGTFPVRSFKFYTPEGFFGDIMVSFNQEVYFTYNDSIHGMELWKTNGTASGTMLVKDIEPGHKSSGITDLAVMNGMLIFKRIDNIKSGIWKSDGTTAGTTEIINQYHIQYQSPFNVSNTILNGYLYYFIQDVTGFSIWKTNGTVAGTVQVKKLYNESAWGNIISVLNNQLLFSFSNSVGAKSLWKTDGTETGTIEIAGIEVGNIMNGIRKSYTVIGSILYFNANTAQNGIELWKTNGTPSGTMMVKDIMPGSNSSQPLNFASVNGKVMFTANDGIHGNELWVSDGTEAGTIMIKDSRPGIESSYYEYDITETQQLLFSFYTTHNQPQLWKTDGTIAGTGFIKELRYGTASSLRYIFNSINAYDQFLLLDANNGINGVELWRTDGSETGTFMLPELFPGSNDVQNYIYHFTNLNGKILFRVTGPYPRDELWITDGTSGGTQKIKNSLAASRIVEVNNIAFFADVSNEGIELWKTDGTSAGTMLIKDIWPESNQSSRPQHLTNVNGILYFSAFDSAYKNNLWKSDGTEAGTVRVKKINQTDNIEIPGIREGDESEFINLNGTLFFTADDGIHGMELWKSDGTETGTVMVKDIFAGQNSTTTDNTDTLPKHLTNVNGTLFFVAYDTVNGQSLWKSNGTEAGTVIVKSFGIPDIRNAYNLVSVNGLLIFSRNTSSNGIELWKSDGTTNGTVILKDIAPGQNHGFISMGIVSNGFLYFSANDNISGDEIWRTDGTETGTVMVQNISAGGGCYPHVFARVGTKLYASVYTDNYGKEIWVAEAGITTSVPQINTAIVVRAFPNPTTDQVTIVFPTLVNNTFWQVYNANGTLMKSGFLKAGATNLSINMNSFSRGLYLLKMKTNQSDIVLKKIIKQ